MSLICSKNNGLEWAEKFKQGWSDFFNIKNAESEIIAISIGWALKLGYKNPIDVLGLTAHDLKCPAADLAQSFISQDKSVMLSKNEKTYIALAMHSDVEINPIYYTRRSIGDFIISNHKTIKSGTFLNHFCERLASIDRGYYRSMQSCYEVVDQYDCLSVKETSVVYYLMLGMSSTTIGHKLSISKRTAQHTIDRIKGKLNCQTTQQVIELGLYLGFNKRIPKCLL